MAKDNVSWRNWSRCESAVFQNFFEPESVADLIHLVEKFSHDRQPFKCRGSSHSFSKLIADTKSVLLSIDNLSGIESIDQEKQTVTVLAGTKIKDLSRALWDTGWALENLGDIDEQSLAGAISTGTHGTGMAFRNLADFAEKITLISPGRGRWSVRRGDPEFNHVAVGPGLFGVISHYELKIVPRYYLDLRVFPQKLDQAAACYSDWNEQNRNVEFFWFPGTEEVMVKQTNLGVENENHSVMGDLFSRHIENTAFGLLAETCHKFPITFTPVQKLVMALLPNIRKVNRSYLVYSTERHVRFQEMEYSVPYEQAWQVFEQIKNLTEQMKLKTIFPVEARFVAGDELSLSPSYGNKTRCYIALHTYYKDQRYEEFFRRAEEIFLAAGGRPHWGKSFYCGAKDFAKMYEHFPEVCKLRNELDPDALMLTPTLKEIFCDDG